MTRRVGPSFQASVLQSMAILVFAGCGGGGAGGGGGGSGGGTGGASGGGADAVAEIAGNQLGLFL